MGLVDQQYIALYYAPLAGQGGVDSAPETFRQSAGLASVTVVSGSPFWE